MEMPLAEVVEGLRLSAGVGPGARGAEMLAVFACASEGRCAPTLETTELRLVGLLSVTFSSPIRLWRARLATVSRGATFGTTLLRSGFALNCDSISFQGRKK